MSDRPADVDRLLTRVVGPAALRRGRDVLRLGRVRDVTWNGAETQIIARVTGNSAPTYVTSVSLTRKPDGSLKSISGSCACPVGANCKHVAAVVLAALRAGGPAAVVSRPPAIAGPAAPRPPAWETTLRGLVPTARGTSGLPDQPEAALHFAITAEKVQLRPVVPARNGGWAQSGISWSDLGVLRFSSSPRARRYGGILADIASLRAPVGTSYGYYSPLRVTLALDELGRGIWEMLFEARDAGLPMVTTGRRNQSAVPVVLENDPATLALDVVRTKDGLSVRPAGFLGEERLGVEELLLFGTPIHGAALIRPGPELTTLRLARLGTSRNVDAAALLRTPPALIPAAEEQRFLDQVYPALRRSLPMRSSDGSMEFPAPAPPVLRLEVEHLAHHQTNLRWRWRYESDIEERLWAPSVVTDNRDVGHEHVVLKAVGSALEGCTMLMQPDRPERLADDALLDGMATVDFLTQVLPRVREVPGVEVIETGTRTAYRPAVEAPVVVFAGSESADRDWFDLAVTVTVDGQQVPFVNLFVGLASEASHLILASGTYFALDREKFATLIALIEESRALLDAPPATIRLSRLNATMWDDVAELGPLDGAADAWRGAARALSRSTGVSVQPVPTGLAATLRPYQHAGFDWLAFLFAHGLGGVLADEMGLGKTVQALALICHAREQGLTDKPFLVVAPTSVVSNWAAECERFTPGLRTYTVTETAKRRGQPLGSAIAGADIVITSYALFRFEHASYVETQWAGLFLDEAQFAKNHASKAYACAQALPTPFKVLTTGTPLENNLTELWSLLSIAAPGLFPNRKQFEEFYRHPIERGGNADLLSQLRRRIRPLMLRRRKSQVLLDLPDKQEQVIEVELDSRHRRIYDLYLHRERQKVLGMIGDLEKNRFAIFRSLMLLRQASLDVCLVDPVHAGVPATKLDVMLEKIEEIAAGGHRVVVFSQFTRFLNAARDRLVARGLDCCYLDGKTKSRQRVVTEFKSGNAPVFLISLKAGGFGLNLTEADYCIVLDPWWNPAAEAQAVDRIHRIGQTRKVLVYRLVARDTIEEKVMALKAGKAALFTNMMDEGEFASSALTARDIRSLVG